MPISTKKLASSNSFCLHASFAGWYILLVITLTPYQTTSKMCADLVTQQNFKHETHSMQRPLVGIGVFVFNSKNQILLGLRTGSHGAQTWAPPGGHLEFGESFAQCALREVVEETSLVCTEPIFVAVTNDVFAEKNLHYVTLFFKTSLECENQVPCNNEPDKCLEWRWFDVHELPSNLFLPLAHFIAEGGSQLLEKIVA